MHAPRFRFQRRPFPATPDTSYYYPATNHERTLSRLLQAIQNDEGLALLTAEPGLGKTLLCHRLVEHLGHGVTTAFVTNSHLEDRIELLQALLFDLSLPYEGQTVQQLRLRLTDYLLGNYASGKRAVFVVDEAQHLSPDLLEELRLLGNLEAGAGKAVQIILAAQPGLLQLLRRAELAAFNQRLMTRARLDPLGLEEAIDYLMHHLRQAEVRPGDVITDEALELLARTTRGVPRLLNQAAHQSLQLAGQGGVALVDVEVVLETLALLGLEVDEVPDQLGEFTRSGRCEGQEEADLRFADAADQLSESEEHEVGSYRLYQPPQRPAS